MIMTEFMGEVIGTMILVILGCGVVGGVNLKKSHANDAGWIVITCGWGFAVAMAIYAVGRISGAHINPAITLGFAISGAFPWTKVPLYISAQMIGAFLGATVVYFHYLPHWRKTKDQATKLGVFSTQPAIRHHFSNLLSEIIGTFILVLGTLAIGANEFTEGLNPLIVGFLVLSIGLSLGGTTGYAINPARDLGPRVAHFVLPIVGKGSSDWSYSWVPVLGPILGGMYGGVFYQTFFEGEITLLFWFFSALLVLILAVAYFSERKMNKEVNVKEKEYSTVKS